LFASPEEAMFVCADEHVVAFPALRETAPGAAEIVVAPREHVQSMLDVPPRVTAPLFRTVAQIAAAVETAYLRPVHVTCDLGGSPWTRHLHFRVSPRRDVVAADLRPVPVDHRADQRALVRGALSSAVG
jgi:diadenosine tetraphosphate (Ap4A) HIT family hydrolase